LNHKVKKSKIRDPHAPPSVPSTSWQYFQNEMKIEKKYDGKTRWIDFIKEISPLWNKVSAEEKEKYKAKANKETEVYKEKMEKYRQTPQYITHHKGVLKTTLKKLKPKEPAGKPKTPLSAYKQYEAEQKLEEQAKYVNGKVNEKDKSRYRERYGKLSEEKRAKFEANVKEAKSMHATKKLKYESTKEYSRYLSKLKFYSKLLKSVDGIEKVGDIPEDLR